MLLSIALIATFASIAKCASFTDRSGNVIETDQNDPRIDWDLVPKSDVQWSGILAHGCSSALIQTWPDGSNPDPSLPAYLLTAGHCLAPFDTDQHRGKVYMDSTDFPKDFTGSYTFSRVGAKKVSYANDSICDYESHGSRCCRDASDRTRITKRGLNILQAVKTRDI